MIQSIVGGVFGGGEILDEDIMKTLLFVNDDTGFRELCRRVFEEEGYCVVLAPDGAAALGMVAAHRPDVAILDVRMPAMSGLDLAEELDSVAPNCPSFSTPAATTCVRWIAVAGWQRRASTRIGDLPIWQSP